ncbi:CDP-diacylglycerol--serine O-phosphatidyltransferase [Neptunomonas phycophila]|jgi:CDP-diacylglycerol--serine O-phosphatidyltransferase|uniref:CDP-diacylglycerol--serine O-phosphatidyltransferase n=1 Tax=Neptunomonas phycophila TaxID=1572645 RepID=A0AAW7XFG9_9GAMM|nr:MULTISPECIES: CDP-diacylglycerol--serine O-phosphatidyltransferase [Neptunomonas]MBT3145813.1 CDP-diacylglycerol--serine O-phosphatidyltransferase [Neptunomonas phycophila]MDN2659045.1 CDP-diacylglycerol--serine O-phosphatidyltransferase [Neptunomonas sp. CHC150]MDO6452927.1 CDP-diacylglycerol--serine O-phosphatidyltransferase [Neptunomonas phycophila]MDO6469637.1 CDP-diacylglycerol--serine O-phosphatidyltransferase [Neptunomonas phycophila]MDO6784639.1 CDP-diacylglycerol--serine O-phosphat
MSVEEQSKNIEESGQEESGKPRRGIYLLPNLFTTGALFSGFYAVVAGMNQQFEVAAIAIFVAMVLDGLDGRIARMTNTSSAFGAEYDSLSDMVSFGVAPALVTFSWVLGDLGKLGWFAAFIYVAGAALRLARFNTQLGFADKRYFVGLPSPAAAAAVGGLVWSATAHDIDPAPYAYLIAAFVSAAGILMVSNVLYYSFKDIDLKGKVPFIILACIVLVIGIISIEPSFFLSLLFFVYAATGPLYWVWRKWRKA